MTLPKNILVHSIIITILTICAAGVIFYKFPSLPQNLSVDEVEFARLAYSLKDIPYTAYSPLATGHTTTYFYLILASFNIFDITPFALRLPSAIFGVITVPFIYLIFLEIFTKKHVEAVTKSAFITNRYYLIPALLTFIFLTLRWYFNFARFSFEATNLLFYEIVSLWLLFRYYKTKSRRYLACAGLFAGGAYISYLAGRIFFILPLLVILSEYRLSTSFGEKLIKPLLIFFIPFFIVIAPLVWYQRTHKDIRINQLSYVTNDKMEISEKIEFGLDSLSRTALMFNIKGDMNGRHNYPGKPALNPVIGIFALFGLIYSLKKIKEFPHVFFIAYFVLSMLPMALTYPWEIPNMLRSFTAIPSLIFFVGNTILLSYRIPLKGIFITLALFLIFAASSFYDLRTYFVFQALYVFPGAFIETPESFYTFFEQIR